METDKNYFLVGLFVIAIIVAGFGFTWWLTAADKGHMVEYRVRFAESVGGLKVGSMVRFHGVDVGNVKQMAIDPGNTNLTRVDIEVLESAPVRADTTASLKFLGISGDIYVELTGGSPDAPKLVEVKGEPPEIRGTESSLSAVMDRLPQITEKTDRLLEKLNRAAEQLDKLLSDQNVKTVNSAVHKLSTYLGTDKSDGSPEWPSEKNK